MRRVLRNNFRELIGADEVRQTWPPCSLPSMEELELLLAIQIFARSDNRKRCDETIKIHPAAKSGRRVM